MKKEQEKKIESLKNGLSSACQENAIDNAVDYFNECQERGEETPSEQEFCDYVCEQYRDILKHTDTSDIYKAFNKYGTETEIDFCASLVWQVLALGMTKKDHYNAIIKKAWQINAKLDKIRQECESLINECYEHGDNYDNADYEYGLRLMVESLEDLAGFDLEDTIPDKATQQY